MKTRVKSLLLRISAAIRVRARAHKNIKVVKKRLGLNIILHCRLKPIKKPEPAIETRTPNEKQIANVSGFPAMIFTTENQDNMSRTIPIQTHTPNAINLSLRDKDGKHASEKFVSDFFLNGK
jgi:hypothetical protein